MFDYNYFNLYVTFICIRRNTWRHRVGPDYEVCCVHWEDPETHFLSPHKMCPSLFKLFQIPYPPLFTPSASFPVSVWVCCCFQSASITLKAWRKRPKWEKARSSNVLGAEAQEGAYSCVHRPRPRSASWSLKVIFHLVTGGHLAKIVSGNMVVMDLRKKEKLQAGKHKLKLV